MRKHNKLDPQWAPNLKKITDQKRSMEKTARQKCNKIDFMVENYSEADSSESFDWSYWLRGSEKFW